MLKGETIIYFGPEPWDGLWRNRHQLMSRFASENDVWYVEPATMVRQLFRGSRNKNAVIGRRRTRLFSRDTTGVNVFHSPWWIPITGRAPLKNFSIRLFVAVLAFVARARNGRLPIVWLSRPNMLDYIGCLHEKLTIYHVVDEYSGYGVPTRNQQNKPARREDDMLQCVDAVIVVTPTLFELKSPHNPNTHLVPNAVDFDLYSDAIADAPQDMSSISGPIIGYSGLIAARLDLQLLLAAAKSKPDWAFVFVGTVNDEHCQTQMQQLRDQANVYFLGQKSVQQVAQYVQHFDVCMIPYTVNLRAQHASPLKLYEYAAASRPIVSTDFAAARAFAGHIHIADTAEEFVSACDEALAESSTSDNIRQNLEFAAENTWEHRVEQIARITQESIDANRSRKRTID